MESDQSWTSSLTQGGPWGMAILGALVLLSLWTWAVVLERAASLRRLRGKSSLFLDAFWEAQSLSELHMRAKDMEFSPARDVFRAGYNEMLKVIQARDKALAPRADMPFATVERALTRSLGLQEEVLQTRMGFLASCASAGPFVGLLGTVIGVIRAFGDIGRSGATSLAAVAPGISEALVATALGLACAIPAAVFYNVFQGSVRKEVGKLEGFSSDFLNLLQRHFTYPQSGDKP